MTDDDAGKITKFTCDILVNSDLSVEIQLDKDEIDAKWQKF